MNKLISKKHNGLIKIVTRSNAWFLFKDVITEFRGWGDEIHMYPLSFVELMSAYLGTKQELYLKQKPIELEKLVEIAKIQSTKASNAIEGIVTANTRIRQLVEEKTTPKNRNEQENVGYRDVWNVIHESFDAIPITKNYIIC